MGKGSGAFYGIGFIGVLIYFMQHATNAAEVIVGFVKAIVWPGILTYNLFGFLKIN